MSETVQDRDSGHRYYRKLTGSRRRSIERFRFFDDLELLIYKFCVAFSLIRRSELHTSNLIHRLTIASPSLATYDNTFPNWCGHDRVVHFYSARNARIASAVLATAIPSVCPSVRLSVCLSVRHTPVLSKRRHVARCSLHRWIAKCD